MGILIVDMVSVSTNVHPSELNPLKIKLNGQMKEIELDCIEVNSLIGIGHNEDG